MTESRARLLVLIGAGLWCSAIVLAAIFHVEPVYAFFAAICHQDPARSWFISGAPLPVCIRCTSIYFGFFAALLLSLKPNTRALKIAIAVSVAEFIVARILVDSAWLRAITGFALGASAAPIVASGVAEMLHNRLKFWKHGDGGDAV
jgi:uncharacterized membrane protein